MYQVLLKLGMIQDYQDFWVQKNLHISVSFSCLCLKTRCARWSDTMYPFQIPASFSKHIFVRGNRWWRSKYCLSENLHSTGSFVKEWICRFFSYKGSSPPKLAVIRTTHSYGDEPISAWGLNSMKCFILMLWLYHLKCFFWNSPPCSGSRVRYTFKLLSNQLLALLTDSKVWKEPDPNSCY